MFLQHNKFTNKKFIWNSLKGGERRKNNVNTSKLPGIFGNGGGGDIWLGVLKGQVTYTYQI